MLFRSSDNSEPDYINLPEPEETNSGVVMRKKGVQKSASTTNANRMNHFDGKRSHKRCIVAKIK